MSRLRVTASAPGSSSPGRRLGRRLGPVLAHLFGLSALNAAIQCGVHARRPDAAAVADEVMPAPEFLREDKSQGRKQGWYAPSLLNDPGSGSRQSHPYGLQQWIKVPRNT